jgi:hypothetical protein
MSFEQSIELVTLAQRSLLHLHHHHHRASRRLNQCSNLTTELRLGAWNVRRNEVHSIEPVPWYTYGFAYMQKEQTSRLFL